MEDYISIFCPYCHQYTSITVASRTVRNYKVSCIWERGHYDLWWIGICNCCKNPVLVHNEGETIYPHPLPPSPDKRIPQAIRKDLKEAKVCFSVSAYRACAVMARRALQAACLDKGALGKRLIDQINDLASKGIITKDLKEWADVVRWVGNDAAHPTAEEVTQNDADDVLKLAEQFLHVLYVAPAIAKEQKAKRIK